MIAVIKAKTTSQPMLAKSMVSDSFFNPLRYRCIGLPKTKRPVTEAEMTKRSSMNTGAKKLSGLFPKILVALKKNKATADMYKKVQSE